MRTRVVLTTILSMVCAITIAYAATWAVKGNIPFQFRAGSKVFPPGDYQIVPEINNEVVRVEPSKGPGVMVPVITRLAPGVHSTATDAHLVFDKVGNTYTLSELWFPEEEGFLLHITKGKHEHHVLHMPHL